VERPEVLPDRRTVLNQHVEPPPRPEGGAPAAAARPPGWLHALYGWTMAQASRPHALWILALISFLESSVFPIPPDVLLIPMVLAAPRRAWLIAGVCTVSSVVGGMLGYAIGALLFDAIGRPVLEFYGYLDKFAEISERYNEWVAWIVFGAGRTPFPYKVITISSGVTGLCVTTFLNESVLESGMRF
jgi:membrane protein YqaA with SNARE-associated domain